MFDINTIPKVYINPGKYGDISVELDNNIYKLKNNNVEWNSFNLKNMREYYEQWSGYDISYGDVLLTGLGFGHMATWVSSKKSVKTVTVIENSQGVIDAFTQYNKIPSNMNIILDDANFYKSSKKYDCIIFDHINGMKEQSFYKDLCSIAKNINHDIFWFWSIEAYYLIYHYDISIKNLYITPIDFKPFDFYTKWEELRNKLDMPTIPSLSKDKINSYINSYFLRHLIQ